MAQLSRELRETRIAVRIPCSGLPAGCGVHPSFMPREALQHCDAVVIGEAELVMARVLSDLEQGCLRGTYRAELGRIP